MQEQHIVIFVQNNCIHSEKYAAKSIDDVKGYWLNNIPIALNKPIGLLKHYSLHFKSTKEWRKYIKLLALQ